MDKSYTRQSKLIKRINLAVWGLLFIAGALLCQRVYSDRTAHVQDVAGVEDATQTDASVEDVFDPQQTEDNAEQEAPNTDAFASGQANSDKTSVEETEVEEKIVKVDPPPTKPTEKQTKSKQKFQPPPRRVVRQTPKKPTKKASAKSKPAVLATSPITSHNDNSQIDLSEELDIEEEITPTTSNVAKTQQTSGTTPKRVPSRVRKTKTVDSPTSAQSSINLAGSEPKTTKTKSVEPSTRVEPSTTTTKPVAKSKKKPQEIRKESKTTSVKKTEEKPKQNIVKTTPKPKMNPRMLSIENPKKIGYPVSFLFVENQKTLKPGDKFEYLLDTEGSTATIHFDRGGDFGEAILDLKPGAYNFTVTRKGWDVVPQKESD